MAVLAIATGVVLALVVLWDSFETILVPRLEALPGVALRHFDMKLAGGVPVYPYRLEEGAFAGRMAMVLLAQEKLLDALGRLPPRASAAPSPPAPRSTS